MKLNIVFDSPAIARLLQTGNTTLAPSLSRLLGMASASPMQETLQGLLCATAGVSKQVDWPIAAISSRAEQWDGPSWALQQAWPQHQHGYWLLVDPVHFVLQRDYFTLAALLAMPETESQALLATLNRHFAEDGLTFLASADQRRWYLYLQDDPQITTTSPQLVLGQATTSYMPAGKGAAKWNRLLNEVQMLLFEHPVNQLREQRGELAVNSIWLSGGGRQPVLQEPMAQQNVLQQNSSYPGSMQPHRLQVISNDVFVQGLGMLNLPHVRCDQIETRLADSVQSLLLPGIDEVWLMGDVLSYANVHENIQPDEAEVTVMHARQERWFKSILTALRKARITQLHIYIGWQGHNVRLTVKPADSWKFWRKPKPLAELLSGLASAY